MGVGGSNWTVGVGGSRLRPEDNGVVLAWDGDPCDRPWAVPYHRSGLVYTHQEKKRCIGAYILQAKRQDTK